MNRPMNLRLGHVSAMLAAAILWSPAFAVGQQNPPKGPDINNALIKEFQQLKVHYILERGIKGRIGAAVDEVDDALRAHLDLPEKQGLVVTRVVSGRSADEAGIQQYDILLSAEGKPLTSQDELKNILDAGKGEELSVTLLRAGDERTVQIKPGQDRNPWHISVNRNVLSPKEYWIGVRAVTASPVVRAQLRMPEDRGLVVQHVVHRSQPKSPAEKAGLKKHDILLSVNGEPLKSTEDLKKAVEASGGKTLSIRLLRKGKERTVEVTPVKRPRDMMATDVIVPSMDASDNIVLSTPALVPSGKVKSFDVQFAKSPRQIDQQSVKRSDSDDAEVGKRLDDVLQQLEKLQKSVEEIRQALPKQDEASDNDGKK